MAGQRWLAYALHDSRSGLTNRESQPLCQSRTHARRSDAARGSGCGATPVAGLGVGYALAPLLQ